MRKIFLTLLLATFFSAAKAQDAPRIYTLPSPFERYTHFLVTGRVTGAMPIGSFSDAYIDDASLRNFSISLEWVLRNSRISVGGELGTSYFQKRLPRALYQNGDETLSAVQTRTLTQTPLQAFVNYHFLEKSSQIQPYAQLSAGASFGDYSLYYGSLVEQQRKVAAAYGVGIGSKFLFKKDGSFGADVRVKYEGTTFKYGYIDKGTATVNGSIGLFYRWW
jgi:outer membrane protein W